jgi:hypothetical protein
MTHFILAWRPFLEPINALHDWWWVTLFPLALFVAVIYKTTRVADTKDLPKEAARLTAQIILGMIGLGVAIHVVAELATHSTV